MIITEFDEEVFVKGIKAEGFEEGVAQGIEQGIQQGTHNILQLMDYISEHPDKSDSEVAAALGCDPNLVAETRRRRNH